MWSLHCFLSTLLPFHFVYNFKVGNSAIFWWHLLHLNKIAGVTVIHYIESLAKTPDVTNCPLRVVTIQGSIRSSLPLIYSTLLDHVMDSSKWSARRRLWHRDTLFEPRILNVGLGRFRADFSRFQTISVHAVSLDSLTGVAVLNLTWWCIDVA